MEGGGRGLNATADLPIAGPERPVRWESGGALIGGRPVNATVISRRFSSCFRLRPTRPVKQRLAVSTCRQALVVDELRAVESATRSESAKGKTA